MRTFDCRPGCGACCIAPSISSPIPGTDSRPGLPQGKPAGLPCAQLSDEGLCLLYGDPRRPAVCLSLEGSPEMCGSCREEALYYLADLEAATLPELRSEGASHRPVPGPGSERAPSPYSA